MSTNRGVMKRPIGRGTVMHNPLTGCLICDRLTFWRDDTGRAFCARCKRAFVAAETACDHTPLELCAACVETTLA